MPLLFQCIDESSGEKDGTKPSCPDWAAGWSERLTGMWLLTHRLRKGDAINFQGWDLLHWIQCLEFSRKLWKQTCDYSTAIRHSSSLFSSPRTQLPIFFSYLFFLSTLILIFAVNYAVPNSHWGSGITVSRARLPYLLINHHCSAQNGWYCISATITVPVIELCLSPCLPIEPVLL